jgi:hypothetical protein
MKITRENQNLLVLQESGLFVYVFGTIFILLGLFIVFSPSFLSDNPPLWTGIVGILLGSLVIVISKNTTISLDKTSNKLLFLKKGITGQTVKEYSLDQIKEIEMFASYSSSSSGSGYSYHLAFVFKNNEEVPLNPGDSTIIRFMGRQIIPEKKLGEKIADFLNVPFQEKEPLTMAETLSEVTSAVKDAARKEIEKQNKIN